jgi:serine/threonine protein kinase/TolB-like protein/Flp pilus assembly protein TadD
VADLRAALQAALAGRYRLERELGRGGMATVYLAHDLRHDRPVALKVLHGELAASLGPERFQREIRLAARLQHPHILSVHDSGEVAGDASTPPVLWFAMPFVEGESLRDRLVRERQLPIEDVLRIGREAADALEYAHQHGIVHRDIKPENILLSAGHALVADFGIARALAGPTESKLTETGTTLGTPAYMSPEQAAGERAIDHRSDIYSLGCVLFEALAGEPPFTGPTAQSIIARRFTETPRPLRELRETVPGAVEAAVSKALAKSPADRFGSAAEFGRALAEVQTGSRPAEPPRAAPATPTPGAPTTVRQVRRRVLRFPVTAALVIGFLLGLGVLFGWLRSHGREDSTAGVKRLAVLPFENQGAGEDEYFADGVTDEVRGKLASLAGLQVIARSSSGQYKKTSKTPQEIGRELGVDYLLTGTVRWEKGAAGNRVRVSPELIRVATAATTWQQPFDAAITDVFQVQADIAGRVAEALDVALGAPQKKTLAEKPTENLAAYEAFLKGEEVAQGLAVADPRAIRRAIDYYGQAVALDSAFVQAWVQLSRAHSSIYNVGTPAPADADAARDAAERARRLAPERPEIQLALGDYQQFVRGDAAAALAAYEAGLRKAPANAELLSATGRVEQSLGRWQASTERFAKANTVDPRSVLNARRQGIAQLWLRHYPEADATFDRGLAISPTTLLLHSGKAMVRLAQGDLAGARDVISRIPANVEPTAVVANLSTYWDLFWILDDDQQRLLLRLPASAFDDDRSAWGIALAATYALRGDRPRARAYADSAAAAFEEQIRATPDNAQLYVLLGTALAYAGRKDDAVRQGKLAVEKVPVSKDAYQGAYIQHQLARIYILVGEPDKALDQLELLLKIPYYLTPAWLRIDPAFDPIRKHPRFQKLLKGTA